MESPELKKNDEDVNISRIEDGAMIKFEDYNDSTSDCIITKEMVEVESQFEKKTVEEEENLRKKQEEEDENELKEKRYKTLMHLLTQSKFYTEFMLKKLQETQNSPPPSRQPKEQPPKTEVKPEKKNGLINHSISTHSLRERNVQSSPKGEKCVPPFRRAVSKSKGSENPSKAKRKFNITDIIDAETVKGIDKKRKVELEAEGKSEKHNSEADCSNKEQTEGMRETAYGFMVSERQPMLFEGGVLRQYQLEGLEWVKLLYLNGVNGILADEMGLGKTLQTIALLCHLIEKHLPGPFLVIAPLSTLPNWVIEFERFAPRVPVILFHGDAEKRYQMYSQICKKVKVTDDISCCPVILTSYEIPLREKILRGIRWSYLIVDEGHRLKNFKCLLARELREFRTGNRLLLTGTPLQNNLSELWSLLNFLLPEIFDDLAVFESWFDLSDLQQSGSSERIIEQEKQKNVLSMMHQILTPFLLRRVKADVALNIPPKKEIIVYCPMTPIQLDLYRATVEHNYSSLMKKEKEVIEIHPLIMEQRQNIKFCFKLGKTATETHEMLVQLYGQDASVIIPDQADGKRAKRKSCQKPRNYKFDHDEGFEENSNESSDYDVVVEDKEDKNYKISIKLQNPMMQLRKIVNHPYLVHFPLIPGKKELKVDEELIKKSGKLLVLDAMLAKLKQRGHKVLLFSTFTSLLDLLEDYVIMRKYNYVRLDGCVKIEDRQQRIKAFNKDPELLIFLISTRAGGLGINLTGADTVIIYDSDWNPQVDLQAQDRCHRIGQTRPVVVYRLVTAATIDERIVERAAAKRKLEKMIIQKGKFRLNQPQDAVNLKELLELLNSRDYHKKIQSNGYVFTDEELDVLLDRSDMTGTSSENVPHGVQTSSEGGKVFKVVELESKDQNLS